MSIADPRVLIEQVQSWLRTGLRRYVFALAAVSLAVSVRYTLELFLGPLPPFIFFFPTLILVTLFAGFWPGILATVSSAVAVGVFFWAPLNLLGTHRLRDVVALGLFSLFGAFLCGLTDLFHLRQARLTEFERVIEGLQDMIVVVDRDYRYIIANEAFLKYRSVTAAQVLGHRADEVIDPEVFRATVKPKMDECFSGGKVVLYEMKYTYPSLGERDLFVSYFPIATAGGVDRVACVLRDVTEKKQAAAALRESEDRCRDLVEHSEDLVCTHDLDGNLLSVNPAPARVLGYEVADLLKMSMRDLIPPEFRAQFNFYLDRIKEKGADRGLLCVMTRSGERRIWEYSNTLRTEGVASPVVRGMAHDITEKMRAEAGLRSSEQRYRSLFEKNIAGVAIASMDGQILDCNDSWARMLGYDSADDIRGRNASEFYFDPADREPIRHELEQNGTLLAREMRLRRRDGTPLCILCDSVIRDRDTGRSSIQVTAIDITTRKQAQEALQRREEDYRRFVAQSSEGIFREDLDAPIPIDLPEDELVHRILHDSYLAECNDAMVKMYGHQSAQALVGKRLTEMLVAEDPRNIELTREYIRSEFRILERESHETDIHGNPKVFRNSMIGIVEDGNLVCTWGIQRDVTEQVSIEESRSVAESALRKSEENFRNLVEQASDGIFLADAEGRYLDVNTAGAEMLGYTRQEVLQLSIPDVIIAENIPRLEAEIARFAGGAVVTSEWTFRRKDGSTFPVEVCGKRLPGGCLQGIARDITERKRAQEIMRQSEERFRIALRDSPITVFSQDRDLRYTWIYNPHLYLQHDAIGKTDEELLGTKKAVHLTELKQNVLTEGVVRREEIIIPHDGSNYAFDVTLEPLFGSNNTIVGITGTSMDIARLRQLADSLQQDKEKLARKNSYLEEEIQTELGFETIVGNSPALREVLSNTRVVASTDSTVLLLGETGTGKELVARSVHALSTRRERNFIKLNCAAVPSGLLESELFGHEKGAFTGAVNQKIGRIELADQGTIFLDEIGELPPELQPKLLRVLQDREFERLGGVRTLHVDVRIIAATNRDLHQDVADKNFREDLFYRLNVFPIQLPALRDRQSDIPMLVHHFVAKYSTKMKKHIEAVPEESMEVLRKWNWPGNVRELENVIERMVILTNGPVLAPPPAELYVPQELLDDNLTEMEREHIIRVLRETDGILSGVDGAASRLGMKRTTLQSMLKRLGIQAQAYRGAASMYGKNQAS